MVRGVTGFMTPDPLDFLTTIVWTLFRKMPLKKKTLSGALGIKIHSNREKKTGLSPTLISTQNPKVVPPVVKQNKKFLKSNIHGRRLPFVRNFSEARGLLRKSSKCQRCPKTSGKKSPTSKLEEFFSSTNPRTRKRETTSDDLVDENSSGLRRVKNQPAETPKYTHLENGKLTTSSNIGTPTQ